VKILVAGGCENGWTKGVKLQNYYQEFSEYCHVEVFWVVASCSVAVL
jgi:hypothetical protein